MSPCARESVAKRLSQSQELELKLADLKVEESSWFLPQNEAESHPTPAPGARSADTPGRHPRLQPLGCGL